MTTLKKLLFTTSLLFSTLTACYSQCHVDKTIERDFGQIFSRPEIFYKSQNKTVLGNLICILPMVDTSKKMLFLLRFQYLYIGDNNRLELRMLTATFKNKRKLTLTASSLETPTFDRGAAKEASLFKVDGNDFNLIMNEELESLTLTDTRTKKAIIMKPYSKIIVEQNNCIMQDLITDK
jgi:hypothetical protein